MGFCCFADGKIQLCTHWQGKDKNLEQLPSSLTSPFATMPQLAECFCSCTALSRLLKNFITSLWLSPERSSSSLSPLTPHKEVAQGNPSPCLKRNTTLWHPRSGLEGTMTSSTAWCSFPCEKGALAAWVWQGSELLWSLVMASKAGKNFSFGSGHSHCPDRGSEMIFKSSKGCSLLPSDLSSFSEELQAQKCIVYQCLLSISLTCLQLCAAVEVNILQEGSCHSPVVLETVFRSKILATDCRC